jgi:hypothetical protein
LLFLSYAEEDGEAARQIAALLRERGIDFYDWRDRRGGRFVTEMERALDGADAFVALMSPHFLASPWCHIEREYAIHREQEMQAIDPDSRFIYVLEIVKTPYAESGFLRSYDWLDLTSQGNRDEMLNALVNTLVPGNGAGSGGADRLGPGTSLFRNRREELDRVLHGLTNAGGPHFWFVVAPPQLGKTWFLDRLSAEITSVGQGSAQWLTKLVDLRDQRAGPRGDATALLTQLFISLIGSEQAAPRNIAREISRSGKSYLCLLDSAELLAEEAAETLRTYLSSIYHYVQDAGRSDVRLGVVVSTRREQEWRGVAPDPRLTALSLTEFRAGIVLQVLRDLAAEMDRTFALPYFQQNALRIHDLSEGLPALMVPCLQWVRREQWLEPERLETEDLFTEIAHPYIRGRLLAQDSLYPEGDHSAGELAALEHAFRLLVPYRLFTMSHLRHHVDSVRGFAQALDDLGWSVEDMWAAVSGSALLRRPLDEPWQEIYPAIRRLLYRYYYRSADEQAAAHRAARKFVEVWTGSQGGKEQVIGLLESLWHEACEFRLSGTAEMQTRLSDSARTLSNALRPSAAYTVRELRSFASERMRNDEEFQRVVDNIPGLFAQLTSIIRGSVGGPMTGRAMT